MAFAPDILQKAAKIKLALFDVDGVLSDGKLYLGADGTELRSSHVRDGHGFKLIHQAGLESGLISGRPAGAMTQRAAQLGISHCHFSVTDKVAVFESLLEQLSLGPDQVSFMGDDTPDLPLLKLCGLSCAVADAHPTLLETADWVSQYAGGQGAARELCDLLIAAQETAS